MAVSLKKIGLGLNLLAKRKTELEFPTSSHLYPKFMELFGGSESDTIKMFENVTLLVSSFHMLTGLNGSQSEKIVAYSSKAIAFPDGQLNRFYLFADGSVTRRQHNTAEEIWDGTAP